MESVFLTKQLEMSNIDAWDCWMWSFESHKQLFDLLHNKITYVGVTSKNIVLLQNMSKGLHIN